MTPGRAAFVIVALAAAAASLDAQNANMAGRDEGLTYSSGQSVVPVYAGWSRNADGTFDLHFSYLNRNWQEHLHIPIGPDNNIGPATFGPDGGQPTYFLPRNNRWVFSVRVPAEFGTRELVWTLTSHGLTYRAHGTLDPGYAVDDFTIQHEYGSDSTPGRKPPTLRVEGEKRRAARVGERVEKMQDHARIAVHRARNIGEHHQRRPFGCAPFESWQQELRPLGGDLPQHPALVEPLALVCGCVPPGQDLLHHQRHALDRLARLAQLLGRHLLEVLLPEHLARAPGLGRVHLDSVFFARGLRLVVAEELLAQPPGKFLAGLIRRSARRFRQH